MRSTRSKPAPAPLDSDAAGDPVRALGQEAAGLLHRILTERVQQLAGTIAAQAAWFGAGLLVKGYLLASFETA